MLYTETETEPSIRGAPSYASPVSVVSLRDLAFMPPNSQTHTTATRRKSGKDKIVPAYRLAPGHCLWQPPSIHKVREGTGDDMSNYDLCPVPRPSSATGLPGASTLDVLSRRTATVLPSIPRRRCSLNTAPPGMWHKPPSRNTMFSMNTDEGAAGPGPTATPIQYHINAFGPTYFVSLSNEKSLRDAASILTPRANASSATSCVDQFAFRAEYLSDPSSALSQARWKLLSAAGPAALPPAQERSFPMLRDRPPIDRRILAGNSGRHEEPHSGSTRHRRGATGSSGVPTAHRRQIDAVSKSTSAWLTTATNTSRSQARQNVARGRLPGHSGPGSQRVLAPLSRPGDIFGIVMEEDEASLAASSNQSRSVVPDRNSRPTRRTQPRHGRARDHYGVTQSWLRSMSDQRRIEARHRNLTPCGTMSTSDMGSGYAEFYPSLTNPSSERKRKPIDSRYQWGHVATRGYWREVFCCE